MESAQLEIRRLSSESAHAGLRKHSQTAKTIMPKVEKMQNEDEEKRKRLNVKTASWKVARSFHRWQLTRCSSLSFLSFYLS